MKWVHVSPETYKKRAFHRIASAASDAPSAQKEGAGDGNTDQNSVDVANLREGGDPPQEVNRGGDDGGGGDE